MESVNDVEILIVEDNPDDFDKFVDAVRDIGLYWLLLNERPR